MYELIELLNGLLHRLKIQHKPVPVPVPVPVYIYRVYSSTLKFEAQSSTTGIYTVSTGIYIRYIDTYSAGGY